MKNKKLLSTVVTSALVATTMAMPVMAADGDTIDVGVTTKTAVLKVTVPTSLAIAVDQFEMADVGTQIYSGAFKMENNSAIDVKVGIKSTADLKSDTKLVAKKADAAADTAKSGEAWMAVASQTSDGSYADGSTTALKDLTEANANVTTFEMGTGADASKGIAEQTYYLAKATGTVGYKLLNANESAADISYAQFYELTAETVGDQDDLDALLAAGDVYVATAAAADGQALSLAAKGSDHTYAAGEVYYTPAASATAKDDIDASKLYVYANGTADAAKGKAAFRYIGKLSGAQETWSSADITNVHIKYDIVGVTQTAYEKVDDNCTYGLYKEPNVAPSIATTSYTLTANTPLEITVNLGVGDKKATGVSKVMFGEYEQLEAGYASYADGKITLTAANVDYIRSLGGTQTLKVIFNDTASTSVDITVQ